MYVPESTGIHGRFKLYTNTVVQSQGTSGIILKTFSYFPKASNHSRVNVCNSRQPVLQNFKNRQNNI